VKKKGRLYPYPRPDTWRQVFYAEFDGRRRRRAIITVMGE
jgi:thiamine phosphate synthase YjbQ (UPF0047 family)